MPTDALADAIGEGDELIGAWIDAHRNILQPELHAGGLGGLLHALERFAEPVFQILLRRGDQRIDPSGYRDDRFGADRFARWRSGARTSARCSRASAAKRSRGFDRGWAD